MIILQSTQLKTRRNQKKVDSLFLYR